MPINITRVRKTTTSPSVLKSVISLVKGQKSDLTKDNPDLTKIRVALSWDVNQYDDGSDFDLDASAFLVSANGKVMNDADFVFYNNREHPSGAVTHSGDNQEGGGDGEVITVDLKKLPDSIDKVAFTVTIHDAEEHGQSFGQVSNASITIYDDNTNQELIRYDLGGDFSVETAVVVGEIYRRNGEWKFNAIGSGFKGGLLALCLNYGLEVEGN